MEFPCPQNDGFTIYSKSGCTNCAKVKTFLKEQNCIFNVIDCDEYLIDNKEEFLTFIEKLTNIKCRIFPIIFFNGEFIGGYNETLLYIKKEMLTFE
jgi:glutaredoxin